MARRAHELKEGVSYLNSATGMIPVLPGSVIVCEDEDARNLINANGTWDLTGAPVDKVKVNPGPPIGSGQAPVAGQPVVTMGPGGTANPAPAKSETPSVPKHGK